MYEAREWEIGNKSLIKCFYFRTLRVEPPTSLLNISLFSVSLLSMISFRNRQKKSNARSDRHCWRLSTWSLSSQKRAIHFGRVYGKYTILLVVTLLSKASTQQWITWLHDADSRGCLSMLVMAVVEKVFVLICLHELSRISSPYRTHIRR